MAKTATRIETKKSLILGDALESSKPIILASSTSRVESSNQNLLAVTKADDKVVIEISSDEDESVGPSHPLLLPVFKKEMEKVASTSPLAYRKTLLLSSSSSPAPMPSANNEKEIAEAEDGSSESEDLNLQSDDPSAASFNPITLSAGPATTSERRVDTTTFAIQLESKRQRIQQSLKEINELERERAEKKRQREEEKLMNQRISRKLIWEMGGSEAASAAIERSPVSDLFMEQTISRLGRSGNENVSVSLIPRCKYMVSDGIQCGVVVPQDGFCTHHQGVGVAAAPGGDGSLSDESAYNCCSPVGDSYEGRLGDGLEDAQPVVKAGLSPQEKQQQVDSMVWDCDDLSQATTQQMDEAVLPQLAFKTLAQSEEGNSQAEIHGEVGDHQLSGIKPPLVHLHGKRKKRHQEQDSHASRSKGHWNKSYKPVVSRSQDKLTIRKTKIMKKLLRCSVDTQALLVELRKVSDREIHLRAELERLYRKCRKMTRMKRLRESAEEEKDKSEEEVEKIRETEEKKQTEIWKEEKDKKPHQWPNSMGLVKGDHDGIFYSPSGGAKVTGLKLFHGKLFSCAEDLSCRLFDLKTRELLQVLWCTNQKLGTTCLEVAECDGKEVLFTGSDDMTVCCYSLKNFACTYKFVFGARVICLHCNWDWIFVGLASGEVLCLEKDSLKLVRKHKCHSSAKVMCLATGTKELQRFLVTGSDDNTIAIRNAQSFALLRTLRVHSKPVLCLAIHGHVVCSGGEDTVLAVHHLFTGDLIRCISNHTGAVTCVNTTGHIIVTGCMDKMVRCYDIETGDLLRVLTYESSAISCLEVTANLVYIGCDSGLISSLQLSADELQANRELKCKWTDCSRKFNDADAFRRHVHDVHVGVSIGSAKCHWANCREIFQGIETLRLHANRHLKGPW
eukprot:m.31084 g.31084  ORF g.31084 m.31084 type:complete len:903 (+) comp31436_c0_seq1:18-2726(+)